MFPESGEAPTKPGDVVDAYYSALASGQYARAHAMWSPASPTGAEGIDEFERAMLSYQSVEGHAAGPARLEGAAGTIYAEVPVTVSVVRRGIPDTRSGTATLRKCDDVPGCTATERRWHLSAIELGASGT
ncbi:hypothetical protein [Palleronia sp. LCG004]|uniref:hypothetical protein n=1 Tax=Palleronia sp. LCG004 TaxID=3079304 RepID=UPI00294293E2|nr:hypothetical protein [Palleronia sp. LCG004]WOI55450.1 hypothetical protein RVY76_10375 [Palleronia sp. LCG004]